MAGYGTRSYLRSPEHNAMKRERKQATEQYLSQAHSKIDVPVSCTCGAQRYPHKPHGTGTPNYRWAWSRRNA